MTQLALDAPVTLLPSQAEALFKALDTLDIYMDRMDALEARVKTLEERPRKEVRATKAQVIEREQRIVDLLINSPFPQGVTAVQIAGALGEDQNVMEKALDKMLGAERIALAATGTRTRHYLAVTA